MGVFDVSGAELTQNIDAGATEALVVALQALEQVVKATADGAAIADVIVEAKSEVQKSRPDLGLVRGLMKGIAHSVSTMANGPAALEAVRSAAQALGIGI